VRNDSPVVPPDMMRTLSSTTTRRTRIDGILGPAQRQRARISLPVRDAVVTCSLQRHKRIGS
jgi:hypothetical protein